MSDKNLFEIEIAQLIIEYLNLEDVTIEDIKVEEPLFNEGLGLDSIDALELSMAISNQYGFQLKSDNTNNKAIFYSLRSLSKHILENKK
jgi:acyl carrier protein